MSNIDESHEVKVGTLKKRGKYYWSSRKIKLYHNAFVYSRGKSNFRTISLIDSMVKILDGELVYELTTMDGEQLLFRAKTKEECFEWVVAIRKCTQTKSGGTSSEQKMEARVESVNQDILVKKQQDLLQTHCKSLEKDLKNVLLSELVVEFVNPRFILYHIQIEKVALPLVGIFSQLVHDLANAELDTSWYGYGMRVKGGICELSKIVVVFDSPTNMLSLSADRTILFYHIGKNDGEPSVLKIRQHLAEFFLEKDDYITFIIREVIRSADCGCDADVQIDENMRKVIREKSEDDFNSFLSFFGMSFTNAFDQFRTDPELARIKHITFMEHPTPHTDFEKGETLIVGFPLHEEFTWEWSQELEGQLSEQFFLVSTFKINEVLDASSELLRHNETITFQQIDFENRCCEFDYTHITSLDKVMRKQVVEFILLKKLVETTTQILIQASESDSDCKYIFCQSLKFVRVVAVPHGSELLKSDQMNRRYGYPFEYIPLGDSQESHVLYVFLEVQVDEATKIARVKWDLVEEMMTKRMMKAAVATLFVNKETGVLNTDGYARYISMKNSLSTFRWKYGNLISLDIPCSIQWSPLVADHAKIVDWFTFSSGGNMKTFYESFMAAIRTTSELPAQLQDSKRTILFMEEPIEEAQGITMDITIQKVQRGGPRDKEVKFIIGTDMKMEPLKKEVLLFYFKKKFQHFSLALKAFNLMKEPFEVNFQSYSTSMLSLSQEIQSILGRNVEVSCAFDDEVEDAYKLIFLSRIFDDEGHMCLSTAISKYMSSGSSLFSSTVMASVDTPHVVFLLHPYHGKKDTVDIELKREKGDERNATDMIINLYGNEDGSLFSPLVSESVFLRKLNAIV